MPATMQQNDADVRNPLTGTSEKPARDPKVMAKSGRGSIGDKAFMDGIIIVCIAWAILIFFYWSLRHHNI